MKILNVKSQIKNISFISWILSLFIFIGLLFWMDWIGDAKPIYQNLAYIWLADIVFGIISFLVLLVAILNKWGKPTKSIKESKMNRKNKLIKRIVIMFLFIVLFASGGVYVRKQVEKQTDLLKMNSSLASEHELTTVINGWEKSQKYQPYIVDLKLCDIASKRIEELSKNWNNASNLKLYDATNSFYDLAENDSKDISSEEDILNRWLNDIPTKKNLTDYYEYSCIKCENNLCVQILGNVNNSGGVAKKGNSTATAENELEWGKTIKVDDITSRTRFANDDHMSTADELNNAMNIYRQSHGLSTLRNDSLLCQIAQKRVDTFIAAGEMDRHEGFKPLFDQQDSFSVMAEVLWSGSGPTSGTHIVEWGWDRSVTGHHEAISDRKWTEGCGAVAGYFAAFVFGQR